MATGQRKQEVSCSRINFLIDELHLRGGMVEQKGTWQDAFKEI